MLFKSIILNESDYYQQIFVTISSKINKEIGKKGAIVFKADNRDKFIDTYDTKRNVLFKKNILDNNNKTHEVWCGPWIDEYNFYIFCEFGENITKGQYFCQFNPTEDRFNYLQYEIHLSSYDIYNITKLDSDIIDLYSDIQDINVIDNNDIYELKFKIKSYNGERIYLM